MLIFKRLLAVFSNPKIQILLITVLTVGVYINTLGNEFVWDDKTFAGWPLTKSFKYLPELLKGALPEVHEGDFRPIKGLILLFDYHLFGNNPFWYHVQAIFIHVSVTVGFYFLTRKIFETHFNQYQSALIALVTALLFGVHPVHTEAVTFVTSSTDLLGIIFFILAFYFYIRATEQFKDRGKFLFFSLIFAFLGYLGYEATLVLLALLVLYDLCFSKIEKVFGVRLPIWALYLGSIICYAVLRFLILGVVQENKWPGGGFVLWLVTMAKVFLEYVSLTVWPLNLATNHLIDGKIPALFYVDYNAQAFLTQKFTDGSFILALAGLLSLVVVGVFLFRAKNPGIDAGDEANFEARKREPRTLGRGNLFRRLPFVTFCIFWFLISLAPFANVLPLNNFMTERYLYLASFGWCLFVAWVVCKLYANVERMNANMRMPVRVVILLVVGIVVFAYGARTYTRNFDWKDSKSLWSKALSQAPNSVLANHNLANVYTERGQFEKAVEFYKKAEENNTKNLSEVNTNYGHVLMRLANYDLALNQYYKAVAIDNDEPEIFFWIGRVYEQKGEIDKAKQAYLKAISLNDNYFDPHINLGTIYAEGANYELAIGEFEKAANARAESFLPYLNLGLIYQKQGKDDLALENFEKVLKIKPDEETATKQMQRINILRNIQKLQI